MKAGYNLTTYMYEKNHNYRPNLSQFSWFIRP